MGHCTCYSTGAKCRLEAVLKIKLPGKGLGELITESVVDLL